MLVKAEVPNPEQTLLPGEYVKVDLNLGDYAGGIVVPAEAVVEAQEGLARLRWSMIRTRSRPRSSRPLDTYQGLVVLESGLKEGNG